MYLHRIAGLFYGRPLLLTPHAADTISNVLLARMASGSPAAAGGLPGVEHDAGQSVQVFRGQERADGSVEVHTPRASRFHGETPLSEDGSRRPLPFRRTAEGVAIITLVGEWVNRGGYVGASSGVISYEGFKYQVESAARDARTKAILLDMESPGGEAVGAFEAAAAVRAAAATKPVWTLVNGLAASAAYAIASASTRIVSIPTGISGSIGVVLAHFDYSEFLKNEGIKPTFIHAGARKVDANPYQALPETVRERLQGEVDTFYDLFVETVAAGRPGLTDKAIRGTEAGTFMGAEALRLGLIDALGTFEDVLADLGAGRGAAAQTQPVGGASPTTTRPAAAGSSRSSDVTDHEASQIRAQERARFRSILGAPEAQGREAQARELAFSTDLSAETAIAIMRSAPNGDASAFVAEKERRSKLTLDPEARSPTGSKIEETINWDEIVAGENAKVPGGAKRSA